MKIAILYVCTGRYAFFWKDFFKSAEKYFLSGHHKEYFVFTDQTIEVMDNERVHIIPQQNLGWPDNTLLRYHMFQGICDLLVPFDYCCFFNSNAEFCSPVGAEFLPTDNKMLFVQHPGFYSSSADNFTYDRNPESSAYVPFGKGTVYVCGGVNCGNTSSYLHFINSIVEATDDNRKRGVIALWHDESHSNRYALDNPHAVLDPGYCYPEGWALPFSPKIRIRDKALHGGHDYLRGEKDQPLFKEAPAITTSLMGGLGNQMFQYAAGLALAFRLNARLVLDISWFSKKRGENETPRTFALELFPFIKEQIAQGAIALRLNSVPLSLFERIKKKFLCKSDKASKVTEQEIPNLETFYKLTAPLELIGYWQNEAFFFDVVTLVRHFFTFPALQSAGQCLANDILARPNSVSVHVRRGDYANNARTNAVHGLCSDKYYAAAISHIKVHAPDSHIYIFSDDPAWVRESFDTQGLPFTVVDLHTENEAHHDMHLMSLCRHHIIANSSFSWWGSWLSNDVGMKIAPRLWFVDPSMSHLDPCPSSWLRM